MLVPVNAAHPVVLKVEEVPAQSPHYWSEDEQRGWITHQSDIECKSLSSEEFVDIAARVGPVS